MREDVGAVVAAHPLFAGLPGPVADLVGSCARNVALADGALLLREGEPADTLYLIRRGTVSIEVHAPGRGPIVVEHVPAGHVVGWSWIVPPRVWHFDARALGPVGAVAVDAQCLRDKATDDPAFGYQLMSRLFGIVVERLQATRVRLLDLYGPGSGG